MSEWPWLGGRKLREVIAKSLNHVDLVVSTVEKLYEMVISLKENKIGDAREKYKEVVELERKADTIKRDILRSLRGSYIHPLDREDLLRLLLTADDIASYARASGRRVISLYNIGSNIPEDILELIARIAEETVKAAHALRESINTLGVSPERSIELTHEVEKYEEEVDELRMEALEKLYINCRSNLTIDCLLIRDAIEDFESISDKCEDTSDVIRLIALTS